MDWPQVFLDNGVAVAVLCFIGVGMAWVAKRLLGRDEGLLVKIGEKHLAYIDASEGLSKRSIELQAELIGMQAEHGKSAEAQGEVLRELATQHASPESTFSTVRLEAAAGHACDIVERYAEKAEVDIQEPLCRIRDILSRPPVSRAPASQ